MAKLYVRENTVGKSELQLEYMSKMKVLKLVLAGQNLGAPVGKR